MRGDDTLEIVTGSEAPQKKGTDRNTQNIPTPSSYFTWEPLLSSCGHSHLTLAVCPLHNEMLKQHKFHICLNSQHSAELPRLELPNIQTAETLHTGKRDWAISPFPPVARRPELRLLRHLLTGSGGTYVPSSPYPAQVDWSSLSPKPLAGFCSHPQPRAVAQGMGQASFIPHK